MSLTEEPRPAGADDPIDEIDLAILGDVRALYEDADPVPAGLLTRVAFALDLAGLEDEIARLEASGLEAVGVRGTEQSRTITFDSESLTIVVQVSPSGDTMRVDGWLAPPAVHHVRLRTGEKDFHTSSDELGRFVLLDVPHGLVQIAVEAEDGASPAGGRTVVTPAVVL
ncbi:hypothetical protein ABH935_006690 [Catenulispora sp. GAS73]|uniref:hypothetical protein n=1 Tax=Catenulispora sp. GAS73 TaxID=3156269 RepID=UPI0035115C37